MTTTRIAAFVTGLACLALGAVTLAGPSVPDQNWGTRGAVVNGLGLVAFAAMALALDLLRTRLHLARLGRAGTRAAQAGLVLMCLESIASQAHGGNTVGAVFMLGLLAAMVGLALICVDGLRRRQWLAPLPLLALLTGIGAADHGGFVLLGAVWLTLAITTRSSRPQPSPGQKSTTPQAADLDQVPAAPRPGVISG
jgi:hypothetical protein